MPFQPQTWSSDPLKAHTLEHVIHFSNEIGLRVVITPGAHGLVSGVLIASGVLHVDPEARTSAVLHEAAHLAIFPGQHRDKCTGDLFEAYAAIHADVWHDPDCAGARAARECGDPEATAWAWAAGKSLGLPEEIIIQNDEYSHSGASMRLALRTARYAGVHGLQHAGWCVAKPGRLAEIRGLPVYPTLARWVQQSFEADGNLFAETQPKPGQSKEVVAW